MQLAIAQRTQQGVRALRAQAAVFERFRGMDRCLRQLTVDSAGPVPVETAAELFAHWGDPLGQHDETFLRSCLAEARNCNGPIVQCGASALTLILGSLCGASAPSGSGDGNGTGGTSGRHLWCLEEDPHWANLTRSWLTQYQIAAAHVITSRAHLFDGYVWYAVDTSRLADQIGLLICEGARATASGVIGSVTRLGKRLAPTCTVLARKVNRAEDLKALNLWARANDASCVVVDREEGFVKITRRPPEQTD